MTPKLTPDQKLTLNHLVVMRHAARSLVRAQRLNLMAIDTLESAHSKAIRCGDREAEVLAKVRLDRAIEARLDLRFRIIQTGQSFVSACRDYDRLPREVMLRALSVNECMWTSPEMLAQGGTALHVVVVLDLENSATRDDATVIKPLRWCCTLAMMNRAKTDPRLGRAMHDACNEVFGDVFGKYQEPSMLERLGG